MRLAAQNVSKTYGALRALDGVSLCVDPGEILGVAGPNGAGKSTLFDVLSGHQGAHGGTVEFDGRDITSLSAHHRARRGLARTFQSPIVPGDLTVGEVLRAAEEAWRVERGHPKHQSAKQAAEFVNLDSPSDRLAGVLDTLARRKLLLACLLVHRPTTLLLDEPCSGLLGDEIDEMEGIVTRLRKQTGMSLMVVEHRLELLTAICDRIVVLDCGQVIAEDTPATVFDDPVVQEAYFQTPQVGAPAE